MTGSSTVVLYHYTPSVIAAVLFAAIFFLTTALHLIQRVNSHAKYMNPFIVGGIFQVIGYGARAASHFKQTSTILYAMQSLFLLLAPILYAASVYMLLGRIITFLRGKHLSYVPVELMTKIFVGGDILSFIVQGAGGGIMSHGSANTLVIGQWVIVAGLCIQLLFFGAFLLSSVLFHRRILKSPTSQSERTLQVQRDIWPRDWRGLLYACYVLSGLILVRSIYRLIEFAQGNDGYLIDHEVFLYVFDAVMMVIVMVIMNLFHPSAILQSDGSEHCPSEGSSLDALKQVPERGDQASAEV